MPRQSLRPSANAHSSSAMSPTKSALKSPMKLPLNNDKEEKSVRFKSRQALHEIQMNSIKAAVATPRKRQSLSQTASPRTPLGDDKENSERLDTVAGNAVTPMKRVPILANFEEWMKMATDNKINANNSWNFALIDYFHDMSLLREGDSVNFQKASCTLDGCVKIYTSRVDSVATETGKLLSGLADSSSKKRRGDGEDERADDEDDDEDGEDGTKKRPKKRVQRSSEATLASSFAQLQLKKMDLEFSVDPLFKKATADFDEGGAKGLLLNHLTIDAHGRIVFDSSDDMYDAEQDDEAALEQDAAREGNVAPPVESSSAPIDLDSLATRFFPNLSALDDQDICPSLKTFELGGAAETLDIPFLKAGDDWKKDLNESAPNDEYAPESTDIHMSTEDDDVGTLGGFDVVDAVGFGEGGEAWARDAAIDTQARPFDAGLEANADDEDGEPGAGNVGNYDPDGAAYGVTLSQVHDPENILSYFDKALSKNWAGPEHWRIRKIKDVAAKPAAPRQRKEKEPFSIDFAAPLTRSLADALYTPAASNSAISLPKAQWRSKTRNLLPDDKHFNSRQLLRLFLKPKARIGARRAGPSLNQQRAQPQEDPHAEMDPAFWAQHHAEAAAAAAEQDGALAARGDYDADFFADDALGGAGVADDDESDEFADAREAFSPGAEGGSVAALPGGLDGALNVDGAAGAEGGFGSQLVTQSRRLRPEYVQYARVAKKVDVRRLKEEMWKGMGFPVEEPPKERAPVTSKEEPLEQHDPLRFTNVMNDLQSVYPSQAMADISTSYCFICLLHLANEKGLVLQNAERGRFEEIQIHRDWSADLSTGDV